jgi:nucleotide-binding universal stress UspA family protein
MYAKILVPIDGSETSTLGLNEAIRLAKNQGGRIRLIHIVNELIVVLPEAYVNIERVIDELRTRGRAILDSGEATVRSGGVEVDTTLVEAMGNQAGDQIIHLAKEWGADLIVCGTHGRRGIRRIVMGSDAEYIVRHTPVPILLVRSHATLTTSVSANG